MFRRSLFTLTLTLAALLALAAPALAGGWAIVTLDTLPREARAGETLHLGFMVRQHGKTPINDVSPYLLATKQGTTQAVQADARQEACTPGTTKRIAFMLKQQTAYRYLHADVSLDNGRMRVLFARRDWKSTVLDGDYSMGLLLA